MRNIGAIVPLWNQLIKGHQHAILHQEKGGLSCKKKKVTIFIFSRSASVELKSNTMIYTE